MVIKYFVTQKKHNSSNDTWDNGIHVKNTINEAKHQFHAFMSTYGYGQDQNIDFASCMITDSYGGIVVPEEVDNRMAAEEPAE